MTIEESAKFLTMKAYRRKRLVEGARLVPVVGAVVLLFPLVRLFVAPDSIGPRIIYIFVVWFVLIAGAFFLSRRLQNSARSD